MAKQPAPAVAIVGAGFSGTLLALHLLEVGPPDLRILLVERTPGFGPGLAYAAHNPLHLLNVRVGNMSAWPDRPRHLEQWLAGEGGGEGADPAAFITRGTYGRYLASMLRAAVGGAEGARRLVLVPDEVVGLERRPGGLRLSLAMGRTLDVDAAVLAVGNLPPAPAPGVAAVGLPAEVYAPDPWAADALDGLDEAAPILLLGTGLTMVDVSLALDARGHRGPILALSRRGLAPHRHSGFFPIPAGEATATAMPLSQRLRRLRRRADEIGWRSAVDELRPAAQAIWRAADMAQRKRFLRHLRPWWDIHRHRMAPVVADRIDALRGERRLVLAAGRIVDVRPGGAGAIVTWRPRGERRLERVEVARIVNCTGPAGDPTQTGDPLLRRLLDQGRARVDRLGLGLDVDAQGRLIDAEGQADPRLYAVGPITKGAAWEIIAVPDIRNQVAEMAARLGPLLARGAPNARRAG